MWALQHGTSTGAAGSGTLLHEGRKGVASAMVTARATLKCMLLYYRTGHWVLEGAQGAQLAQDFVSRTKEQARYIKPFDEHKHAQDYRSGLSLKTQRC